MLLRNVVPKAADGLARWVLETDVRLNIRRRFASLSDCFLPVSDSFRHTHFSAGAKTL